MSRFAPDVPAEWQGHVPALRQEVWPPAVAARRHAVRPHPLESPTQKPTNQDGVWVHSRSSKWRYKLLFNITF